MKQDNPKPDTGALQVEATRDLAAFFSGSDFSSSAPSTPERPFDVNDPQATPTTPRQDEMSEGDADCPSMVSDVSYSVVTLKTVYSPKEIQRKRSMLAAQVNAQSANALISEEWQTSTVIEMYAQELANNSKGKTAFVNPLYLERSFGGGQGLFGKVIDQPARMENLRNAQLLLCPVLRNGHFYLVFIQKISHSNGTDARSGQPQYKIGCLDSGRPSQNSLNEHRYLAKKAHELLSELHSDQGFKSEAFTYQVPQDPGYDCGTAVCFFMNELDQGRDMADFGKIADKPGCFKAFRLHVLDRLTRQPNPEPNASRPALLAMYNNQQREDERARKVYSVGGRSTIDSSDDESSSPGSPKRKYPKKGCSLIQSEL